MRRARRLRDWIFWKYSGNDNSNFNKQINLTVGFQKIIKIKVIKDAKFYLRNLPEIVTFESKRNNWDNDYPIRNQQYTEYDKCVRIELQTTGVVEEVSKMEVAVIREIPANSY